MYFLSDAYICIYSLPLPPRIFNQKLQVWRHSKSTYILPELRYVLPEWRLCMCVYTLPPPYGLHLKSTYVLPEWRPYVCVYPPAPIWTSLKKYICTFWVTAARVCTLFQVWTSLKKYICTSWVTPIHLQPWPASVFTPRVQEGRRYVRSTYNLLTHFHPILRAHTFQKHTKTSGFHRFFDFRLF